MSAPQRSERPTAKYTAPRAEPARGGALRDPSSRRFPWKSYLVMLSLWTDPHYVTRRVARRLARALGRSAPPVSPLAAHAATRDRTAADELAGLEVDLVYFWVSGQDPAHREKRNYWLRQYGLDPVVANPNVRYVEDDELRYSLRSVERNMPWVRRIFIVTDNQVPSWLDRSNPRVRVVDHTEIFADPSVLPTFNSQAIEAQVDGIADLAEHFIMANDDMFVGQPCRIDDFFARVPTRDGHAVVMRVMESVSDDDWIVPWHRVTHDPLMRIWMAGWNNVKLELERRRPWRRVRHVDNHQAHGLTRSAFRETVRLFPEAFRRTSSFRFRSLDNVHFGRLTRYRCLLDGTAVRGYLPCRVFGRERELDGLTPGELPTLFCVNGGPGDEEDTGERALQRLFPEPSSFELPSGAVARQA